MLPGVVVVLGGGVVVVVPLLGGVVVIVPLLGGGVVDVIPIPDELPVELGGGVVVLPVEEVEPVGAGTIPGGHGLFTVMLALLLPCDVEVPVVLALEDVVLPIVDEVVGPTWLLEVEVPGLDCEDPTWLLPAPTWLVPDPTWLPL